MSPTAPPDLVRRILLASSLGLATLGLATEAVHYTSRRGAPASLVAMLSLSYEHNLPTWFAVCLLFSCALALYGVAARAQGQGEPWRRHWWALCAAFLYMSLDELVQLHEHLGFLDLGGVLYFSWVVPAGAAVLVMGLVYLPFLLHLPARRRRQFILAGALYVGGALLVELPLGWWTERAGNDNLVYAAIDHVEEAMEMVGASLFLCALLEQLGGETPEPIGERGRSQPA